ncbi:MAG: DNA repair protein RecO [Sphingobacterium sp.]
MLHKTKGIALKVTDYSESSVVAQIYTEAFGLQSYLINGAKKPRAKISSRMLQPFHLLELTVYQKETGNLQRIKEAHQSPVLRSIPLDIVKSSLAIFLNEVLFKVLRHQQAEPLLYRFLENAIVWLDETENSLANFHLVFLAKLSHFLGFRPRITKNRYFDLLEGQFSASLPNHLYFMDQPNSEQLSSVFESTFSDCHKIRLSKADRSYLLEKTIDFYRLHTENFGQLNSMYVLEEIFNSE